MTDFHLTDPRNFTIINWLDKIEGPAGATNLPSLAANMENDDDPWDWSIDRVVQEFCTANRSWELRSASMILPDPAYLGQALRDQQVTGDTLLNEIDHATMRIDLGLQTIGQRAFVNHGISALRLRSAKYQAANQPQQLAISRLMLDELSRLIKTSSDGYTGRSQHAKNDISIIHALPDGTAQENEIVQMEDILPGGKRQRLDGPDPAAGLDHSFSAVEVEQGMLTSTPASTDSTPEEPVDALAISGKKRKRIAPTLVTSQINSNLIRHIPTAADLITLESEPELEPAFVPEPGITFLDSNGRKRMLPVWQAEASYAPGAGASTISNEGLSAPKGKISKAAKHISGYLGRREMTIDQVFYPDVSVGEELPKGPIDIDEVQGFSMMCTKIPNGQRLYVHSALRRFFQIEPREFRRHEEVFTAVLPYPERLALKYHQQTFSLYSSGSARRENVDSWPEINTAVPSHQMIDAHTSAFNPTGPGIFGELGRYEETFDPSYLERKYKYLEGGDEVLPLYGDSDEDNEYDLATWKEMEEERGELQRTTKVTRRSFLSLDEIDETIDEGFTELAGRWKSQKLPRLQNRGYKLWRKSRKEGNKTVRIRGAQADLNHIHCRIAKMRKEILEDQWTSKAHVWKQIPIFEVNIFAREELTWKIRLLEQSYCPDQPPPSDVASKKATDPHHGEEEGESINSEDDASSSGDGLGDFLVEDELLPSTEQELHELHLADTEDESGDSDDSEASDTNMSNESQSTPLFLPSPNDSSTLIKTEVASLSQHHAHGGQQKPEVYDLTNLPSSDDSPASPSFANLATPLKPKVKLKVRQAQKGSSPIIIEASDDESILGKDELPPLNKPAAVAKKSYIFWAKVLDRNRLLVTIFYRMEFNMRKSMLQFISNISQQDLWGHIYTVKEALQEFHGRPNAKRNTNFSGVKGMDDTTLQILQGYIKLFGSYLDCCYYAWRETPDPAFISKITSENASQFTSFFELCRTMQEMFQHDMPSQVKERGRVVNGPDSDDDSDDDFDEDARLPARRQRTRDFCDGEDHPPASSHKRKRNIYENTEARDKRDQDKRRLEEQEERRRVLHANLAKDNHGNDEARGRIIINDAAGDDENLIYITSHTSSRIKPHQIDGVRFMWNQVVAGGLSEELMQGCLLAHTMGLGKTMQVITLLVAIAEAAASTDPLISKQIPDRLMKSQTLVLCPAGLVGNWMDELLTWVPNETLGPLEKITATLSMSERLRKIEEWYQDGGVLVIGYEMFRNFIDNKAKKGGAGTALSEVEHESVLKYLLEGPNIIIADEAHKMKNFKSGLNAAAMRFTSTSRIALTGSPLANNVEEYFAMIEWVAPNYLGPIEEFRGKYVRPIEIGLWQDSIGSERRRAFKMLKVLKDTLAPKVNRADMSVLRNDLPPKKEFVIMIPLTDLQRELYSLYVTTVAFSKVSTTKSGDITQSTIWHWLAILLLICNHPRCLDAKIKEGRRDSVESDIPSPTNDGAIPDLDAPVPKSVLPPEFTQAATALLRETAELDSTTLSYKVKILCQILDASAAARDKTLVFSSSITTLDLMSEIFREQKRNFKRLDGTTPIPKRQGMTKDFNSGGTNIFLISTKAGGLGLNLFGANRVVIFDFGFNPTWEEQAVGRAYRIGQIKPTFVYHLVVGGTFEEHVHNKTVFKQQLAKTVVDKKNPIPKASRLRKEIVSKPREVEKHDLTELEGMDPAVLDRILATQTRESYICKIVQTDSFEKDDEDYKLTAEEELDAERIFKDAHLKRTAPLKWQALQRKEERQLEKEAIELATQQSQPFAANYAEQQQQQQQQQQQRQPLNPPQQQNQRTVQSATTGQAIIQASASDPSVRRPHMGTAASTTLPSLQSPTPEIDMLHATSSRIETLSGPSKQLSKESGSPHSLNGTVKKSSRNQMFRLRELLKSAAVSCVDLAHLPPKEVDSQVNTLLRNIRLEIEASYTDQKQRISGVKAVRSALENDLEQIHALLKTTLSSKEFVSKLIIPNQKASTVTIKDGPSQSEMYKVMSRETQQSHNITETPAELKPRMNEDEMAMQKLNQKRRARGEEEVSLQGRGPKIPDWATHQIGEANGREGSSRLSSHASSHKR